MLLIDCLLYFLLFVGVLCFPHTVYFVGTYLNSNLFILYTHLQPSNMHLYFNLIRIQIYVNILSKQEPRKWTKSIKKLSEFDQEILQPHTADKPMAP